MFEKYICEEEISKIVDTMAEKINKVYKGQELILVCILNGSFIFCADLMRKLTGNVTVEFMKASSYEGTDSTGNVQILLDLKIDVTGKNILIVEDIVDTGNTIKKLMKNFKDRNPKSLKLASLLFKPARLEHDVSIDYLGKEIEDKFVIGYGLDLDGRYRELPYIGIFDPKEA